MAGPKAGVWLGHLLLCWNVGVHVLALFWSPASCHRTPWRLQVTSCWVPAAPVADLALPWPGCFRSSVVTGSVGSEHTGGSSVSFCLFSENYLIKPWQLHLQPCMSYLPSWQHGGTGSILPDLLSCVQAPGACPPSAAGAVGPGGSGSSGTDACLWGWS